MKPAKLEVELENVVKNYDFDEENGFLFCIFETISNSLYCRSNSGKVSITVKFTREYRTNELVKDDKNVIITVSVTDNGIGFTDENYNKFTKKLYESNHDGGKGYGRIAYLKVFNDVSIESTFLENGKSYTRNFKFDLNEKKDTKKETEGNKITGTTIYLKKIKDDFRDDAILSSEQYAEYILHHFYIHLYYLLERNIEFEIKVLNDSGELSEQIINSDKLKNDIVKKVSFDLVDPDAFDNMNTNTFEVIHIKTKNVKGNKAFYVVDERSAGEIKKLDIPPGMLEDSTGKTFYYYVYLKSSFFNKFLNDSRTKLSLPSDAKNKGKNYFTEDKILMKLQENVNSYLKYELTILEKKIEEKISNTLTNNKYNKICNNKNFLYMLTDDDLKKELLHKIKFGDTDKDVIIKTRNFHEELQEKTIKQVNSIVEKLKTEKEKSKDGIDFNKIEEELQSLILKVNIENSINLSSYIMYRKYVLDLFHEGLEYYKKSKDYNEAFFHNILMSKRTSNTVDSNLWMLDDLFLFFEGRSEKSIIDIEYKEEKIIRDLTDDEKIKLNEFEKKRMERRIDLLFFPEEKKCIIIELKDPKVDMVEGVSQLDRYTEFLANFIKPEFSIDEFFTYLITDNFNLFDKPSGYRKIYGLEGFVRDSISIKNYYNDLPIANQYSEVVRYTDIYERARKRNKIFMQKLNIYDTK